MRNYPESLRDQANQLAMAQSCGIHDGYTWADAFEELTAENLWDDNDPATEAERFTPTCQFSGLTFGELAYHVETEAMAIYEELKKAYDLGVTKPHDDLTFARYQGFHEYLIEGPDAGRTHATNADWNEAYDAGRNEASKISLAGGEWKLPKGERCWVTAGNASVLINAEGDGVIVDVFPLDREGEESVASTKAHDNDLSLTA